MAGFKCEVFSLAFCEGNPYLSFNMRILVQNAASNVYFDGVDWNENAAQAKDFESVLHAESFCREHELSSVLIVVKSKDGRHDISYPFGGPNSVLLSKPATTKVKSLC